MSKAPQTVKLQRLDDRGWLVRLEGPATGRAIVRFITQNRGDRLQVRLSPSDADDQGNTVYDPETHIAAQSDPVTINGVAYEGWLLIVPGTAGESIDWQAGSISRIDDFRKRLSDAALNIMRGVATAVADTLDTPALLAMHRVSAAESDLKFALDELAAANEKVAGARRVLNHRQDEYDRIEQDQAAG